MNFLLKRCGDYISGTLSVNPDNSPQKFTAKKRMSRLYIILGFFFLFQCYSIISWAQQCIDNKWGVLVRVRPIAKKLGAYKTANLGDGNFYESGMEGRLYWHPHSLTESIMLNTFAEHSPSIDLFELSGYILLAVFFMFLINDAAKATYFNKNIIRKFSLIVFVVAMWHPVLELIRTPVSEQYIKYITRGQFMPAYSYGSANNSMILYVLLGLLIIFPQKALEIQKEAELTI